MSETLELWDYRRRVQEIYRKVRFAGPAVETWLEWARDRDLLFAEHPQSPFEDRSAFVGIRYFPYESRWRTLARFTPVESEALVLLDPSAVTGGFVTIGTLDFEVDGHTGSLDALWLNAYAGGLFVPFRDGTSGSSTYGGGRYLLDTAKGADMGHDGDSVVLDFNYAYHPSCVHSPRWSCPLAPPQNTLAFAVEAGERLATPG